MTTVFLVAAVFGAIVNGLSIIILTRLVHELGRDVEELRRPWPGDRS